MLIYVGVAWVVTAFLWLLFGAVTESARAKLDRMKEEMQQQVTTNGPVAANGQGTANGPITTNGQGTTNNVDGAPGTTESPRRPRSKWAIALGVLAFLLSPLLPVVLFLNSYVLSISLSVVLPQGNPLFTLTVGSWVRDIFITDILAFVIAVLQGVGGAIWLRCLSSLHEEDLDKGSRAVLRKVLGFAISLTIIALAMEFGVSAYRGWLLGEGDIVNAVTSGGQALVTGFGDVVLGALVIDFLLVPVVVGIAGLFQRGVGGIVGSFQRASARRSEANAARVVIRPTYPSHLRILAFLDRTIVEWMRVLDRWAGRRIGRG